MIRLEVAPQLRFLLPARRREGIVEMAADPCASLGHLVQAPVSR